MPMQKPQANIETPQREYTIDFLFITFEYNQIIPRMINSEFILDTPVPISKFINFSQILISLT